MKTINIRPTTGVYATYKNIKYRPWTAIAEFVDNSTQSFYDNIDKLKASKYWKGLQVDIFFEDDPIDGEVLVIRDNAYGMDFKDFQRAIILDSPPKNPTRSEFGMGLKTAACWFGTNWSVETRELGSGIGYKTKVDVDALQKYKDEEIEVEEYECSKKEHGTEIRIWGLNRKIVGRQIRKTKEQLSGMYRTDLREGEISISYEDEILSYQDPEVLTEELPDGSTKVWKQDVAFDISTPDGVYNVNGFIALRDEGSTSQAGFTLIRRGRVIEGGYEDGYRPEEIFEKSNSFVYQRLFGELNLDDWPVTQTKDGFDWYNGLEDALIDHLKTECAGYVRKAKEYRKKKTIDAVKGVGDVATSYQNAGVISDVSVKEIPENVMAGIAEDKKSDENSSTVAFEDTVIEILDKPGQRVEFSYGGKEHVFDFVFDSSDPEAEWLKLQRGDNADLLSLNIRHPFFHPYCDQPQFLEILSKFAFSIALAECSARELAVDGKVSPSAIRKSMNETLREVANYGQ